MLIIGVSEFRGICQLPHIFREFLLQAEYVPGADPVTHGRTCLGVSEALELCVDECAIKLPEAF